MGTTHAAWWNESWKSSHFSGTPGMFKKKKKARTSWRSLQVMKLGSIIMTLRTKGTPWNTAIRNHISWQNSKHRPQLERSWWLFFLEFGRCCSCRLSWKRNNNKLSTLHWNSYCIKNKNQMDWNKKWNTSSTWQCQALHKCGNKRCNSTPGLFSAATSTV